MPTNTIKFNVKMILVKIIVITYFSKMAKKFYNVIVCFRNLKLIIIFYNDSLSNFILLKISLIHKCSKIILRGFKSKKFKTYQFPNKKYNSMLYNDVLKLFMNL